MGTPPNHKGKTFDNRKSAVATPIKKAITREYAMHFLEELNEFNNLDFRQLRKCMNDLFIDELDTLFNRLTRMRNTVYEIKYERSDKGIKARLNRKLKAREKNAIKQT